MVVSSPTEAESIASFESTIRMDEPEPITPAVYEEMYSPKAGLIAELKVLAPLPS